MTGTAPRRTTRPNAGNKMNTVMQNENDTSELDEQLTTTTLDHNDFIDFKKHTHNELSKAFNEINKLTARFDLYDSSTQTNNIKNLEKENERLQQELINKSIIIERLNDKIAELTRSTCNMDKVSSQSKSEDSEKSDNSNNINVNNVNRIAPPKTLPGNSTYSEMTKKGKHIVMFGDSMISNISKKEFNKHIKGHVTVKPFRGASSEDMIKYCEPQLDRRSADIAIIHVGTNDIWDLKNNKLKPLDIAKNIKTVADKCNSLGANQILISSVVKRGRLSDNKFVSQINDCLEKLCLENDYTYINNNNISQNLLANDKLHLSYSGTCALANNFISALNSSN